MPRRVSSRSSAASDALKTDSSEPAAVSVTGAQGWSASSAESASVRASSAIALAEVSGSGRFSQEVAQTEVELIDSSPSGCTKTMPIFPFAFSGQPKRARARTRGKDGPAGFMLELSPHVSPSLSAARGMHDSPCESMPDAAQSSAVTLMAASWSRAELCGVGCMGLGYEVQR